jgi:hypothetical protein
MTAGIAHTYSNRWNSGPLSRLFLLFSGKTLREEILKAILSIPVIKVRKDFPRVRFALRADLQLEAIRKMGFRRDVGK